MIVIAKATEFFSQGQIPVIMFLYTQLVNKFNGVLQVSVSRNVLL